MNVIKTLQMIIGVLMSHSSVQGPDEPMIIIVVKIIISPDDRN